MTELQETIDNIASDLDKASRTIDKINDTYKAMNKQLDDIELRVEVIGNRYKRKPVTPKPQLTFWQKLLSCIGAW